MQSCRESSTGCWSCRAPTARPSRRWTASSRTSASPPARTLRSSTRPLPIDETLGVECLRRGGVTVLRATEGPEVQRCLTPGAGVDRARADRLRRCDPWHPRAAQSRSERLRPSVGRDDQPARDERGRCDAQRRGGRRACAQRAALPGAAYPIGGRDARQRCERAPARGERGCRGTVLVHGRRAATAPHARPLLRPGARGRADPGSATCTAAASFARIRSSAGRTGSELQLEYSSRVLDDGRVHTTFRDISQRRRNEERLRSSLEQLHAIVQTQQEISALQLDPDAVTAAIVERTQRLTGADGAVVQWLDGHEFVYSHASGIASLHVGLRLGLPTSLSGQAAALGETLHCPDVELDDRADRDGCRVVGIRSLIAAPLYRDGRVDGILAVMSGTPNAFDELSVETTRLMAQFVSTVFQNSHVLETRSVLAEELGAQAQVVEHMQTALWIWSATDDHDFVLQYANAASDETMGRPNAKLIGQAFRGRAPRHGRRDAGDAAARRRRGHADRPRRGRVRRRRGRAQDLLGQGLPAAGTPRGRHVRGCHRHRPRTPGATDERGSLPRRVRLGVGRNVVDEPRRAVRAGQRTTRGDPGLHRPGTDGDDLP